MITKFLKCSCENCAGRIEFPAEAVGTQVECPHCHWQTDLTVEVPEIVAVPTRGGLKWAVIGLFVILAGLGIVAPFLLKRIVHQRQGHSAQQSPASASKPATQPAQVARRVENDFEIGPVTIQTSPGGSL